MLILYENMEKKEFLIEFKEKYSFDDIINYIDSLKDLNVLIIGETVIDEYQYGRTLGKCGKFPIVSFKNEYIESYQGGILAIRNHIEDFVNSVDYLTDSTATKIKRYIEDKQKLFETYDTCENIYYNGQKNISEYDLVIIADFGHGYIRKSMINDIERDARFLALNAQNNSGNMGMNTINKYKRWDYLSIDTLELRLACSNQFDKIEDVIKEKFEKGIVSITSNKEGSYLYDTKELLKVPAFAKNIVDTVGAGDAYLSISSLLAYKKAPLEIIGTLGNFVAGIACSYPGNKDRVTKNKLLTFISEVYNDN
jgi:bifunctional ADP-heptose synthase (sugar kinase/adenylyltransferase)